MPFGQSTPSYGRQVNANAAQNAGQPGRTKNLSEANARAAFNRTGSSAGGSAAGSGKNRFMPQAPVSPNHSQMQFGGAKSPMQAVKSAVQRSKLAKRLTGK